MLFRSATDIPTVSQATESSTAFPAEVSPVGVSPAGATKAVVSPAAGVKTATKKSKGEVPALSIERISEHAARALDFSAPVLLVPIRHHSMAMALHLPRIIEAYQPDLICVELPEIFTDKIKDLLNPEVRPPVAFYSFANVEEKVEVSLDPQDPNVPTQTVTNKYTSRFIYPMLPYSPEYVALQEAAHRNIPFKLIDLSALDKSTMSSFAEDVTCGSESSAV